MDARIKSGHDGLETRPLVLSAKKWRRSYLLRGKHVRKRLTNYPIRISCQIEIGFESEGRRDGLASRFFTRKRNGRSAAVPTHTYAVFGGVHLPPSACIFPVINRQAPPVRASSPKVTVPPGRRLPLAQRFPCAVPASPGDQSGSPDKYRVEVELHRGRSSVDSPAIPPLSPSRPGDGTPPAGWPRVP